MLKCLNVIRFHLCRRDCAIRGHYKVVNNVTHPKRDAMSKRFVHCIIWSNLNQLVTCLSKHLRYAYFYRMS